MEGSALKEDNTDVEVAEESDTEESSEVSEESDTEESSEAPRRYPLRRRRQGNSGRNPVGCPPVCMRFYYRRGWMLYCR